MAILLNLVKYTPEYITANAWLFFDVLDMISFSMSLLTGTFIPPHPRQTSPISLTGCLYVVVHCQVFAFQGDTNSSDLSGVYCH